MSFKRQFLRRKRVKSLRKEEQAEDYVIETQPFAREAVRQMVRMTRMQADGVRQDMPYLNVRLAIERDYQDGLRAENLDVETVLAKLKIGDGVQEYSRSR